METGRYVRHSRSPQYGIGRVVEKFINGSFKVVFSGIILTGILQHDLEPVQEREQKKLELEEARRKGPESVAAWEKEQEQKEAVILKEAAERNAYFIRYGSYRHQGCYEAEMERISLQIRDVIEHAQPDRKDQNLSSPGSTWWYDAFKHDASLVKSPPMEVRVVGVTYENRQSVIAVMKENEQVLLVREPDNPFDCNAISVRRTNNSSVGYLPKELAARLARVFDEFGKPVTAMVTSITGKNVIDWNLGVRIRFSIPIIKR